MTKFRVAESLKRKGEPTSGGSVEKKMKKQENIPIAGKYSVNITLLELTNKYSFPLFSYILSPFVN